MRQFDEELCIDTKNFTFTSVLSSPTQMLMSSGRTAFSFALCEKRVSLGDVECTQCWMDTRSIEPKQGRNFNVVVQYFWERCWADDVAVFDEGNVQTYILAKLLPLRRSKGARRIFRDSKLMDRSIEVSNDSGGSPSTDRKQRIRSLNDMLEDSAEEELDIVQFRDRTADFLGPYADDLQNKEVRSAYEEFTSELFNRTEQAMHRYGEKGLSVASVIWQDWMRRIGRRTGRIAEKRALDMISMEARAAFWRCYSQVWVDLIEKISHREGWSAETKLFHHFWHLAHRCESDQSDKAWFHAFRGCPLALHPAAANFIQTTTGRRLLGNWLTQPESETHLHRILHGIFVAVCQYAGDVADVSNARQTR